MPRFAIFAAACALAAASCAGDPPEAMLAVDGRVTLCDRGATERVQLQYLGSGGVLVRRGDAAILTAPFYSNPSLARVALGLRLRPDEERVLRLLPAVHDVRAVLVGHAHYDHLMDLPIAVRRRMPLAVVYGNRTAAHLLAPWLPADRRVALDERAGSWRRPGEWIRVEGAPFRFMALVSDHSPHFAGIELYDGEVERDAERPPERAADWPGGLTLAFLVDVLGDDGSVLLRLHYQDAASQAPQGFPPPDRAFGDGVPVDVAILTVGAFDTVSGYPESIVLRLAPRHALLVHWEDFFLPPERGPRLLRVTDFDEFARRLEGVLPESSGWTLPKPGVSLGVDVCPRATGPVPPR
jgi:L-ascorbate metabolism protein UlaG (beta-lactamase superfamily)